MRPCLGHVRDGCMQLENGEAEGSFHRSTPAENKDLKPKPFLSSTFTLQPELVSLALTPLTPCHTILPFTALKSWALQLLSPGTTSWYLSTSFTLHLISKFSRKRPSARISALNEHRRALIFNSKALEHTLYSCLPRHSAVSS